jgi:acyl dehydratase
MLASKRDDSPTTRHLVAQFTKRDLILYALGIGCCSDELYKGEELRFVYERHPAFEMFPTFLLTMFFAAESKSKGHSGIRPFPPESMTLSKNETGIIPTMFLKNADVVQEVNQLPILHMSQSLLFHNEILFNNDTDGDDAPVRIDLQVRILSIRPRNIGTFVTTETKYYQKESCVATAQMTALVFGLSPEKVVSWKGRDNNAPTYNNITPTNTATEKTIHEFSVPPNAALLYRLSGDYNPIHVEGTDGDDSKNAPILHGLCTMGYATRAILQHAKRFSKRHMRLTSIKCNFVKPVFVGETIRVEVWGVRNDEVDEHVNVCFRVYRSASEEKLVDKGYAKLQIKTASRL